MRKWGAMALSVIIATGIVWRLDQFATALEDNATMNLAFASTAGRGVVKSLGSLDKQEAKAELAWLLKAQASTTANTIGDTRWW